MTIFRKSLIAGAIAALISSPGWAAGTGSEAETDTQRSGSQATQSEPGMSGGQAGAQSQTESGATAATNSLYSMTPQQLRRMDVVGAAGEEIGDVKQVVRGRDEEKIHVVVSAGGFLGVGGKDIIVPLDELTLVEDKLRINATQEELEARPEYQEEQYVELQPSDQPLSDFAAFEPVPGQDSQQQPGRSPDTGTPGGQWESPGSADPAQTPSEPATPGGMQQQ